MRTALFAAMISGAVLLASSAAQAVPVLELSGRVALGDGEVAEGTTVRLKVDLDRDGDFASFETLSAHADADGSYVLSYDLDPEDVDLEFVLFVAELVAEYEARGFEALLDEGPLPAVVSFEREGYSTVTRKISTLIENPMLDALLAPLKDVHCSNDGCQSSDGGVAVSGFPGGTGIARAYAEVYDPGLDTPRFPGSFSDSGGNLLISSGFMEIDFRDAAGQRVTRVSSPVKVRYEANPNSWATLRDLVPDSDVIEVPMYSFDEDIGEWVAEADGVLQDADGEAIVEGELASINDGSHIDPVFVAFSTSHFSTWNCDRPISTRACVKGRFVDADGNPLPGIAAAVQGVSYSGGTGEMMTGADGWFASDLMRSEAPGEDIDGNGTSGETFSARVTVSSVLGVYEGPAFDSPVVQGSIGGDLLGWSPPSCTPADCECLDLGDIVAEFETPRVCRVDVSATFSGWSLTFDAELEAGAALAGATVRGEYAGQTGIPISASAAICEGETCHAARADAEDNASFVVPVIGDAPEIQVSLEYSLERGDALHYYTGSLTVPGCARDETEVAARVNLEATHVSLKGLGGFIAALGSAAPASTANDPDEPEAADPMRGPGCGCVVAGGNGPTSALYFAAAVVFGLLQRRRRPGSPKAGGRKQDGPTT
jgi:MYXO-CTERM domain-containing protein